MVYGANGYSAQLIISELLQKDINPILAGRNNKLIMRTAKKYNCEFRVFDLNNYESIIENLQDIHTLLNCAGPFMNTAKPLIEACLAAKTNYLDLTGEIPVLEQAFHYNHSALKAGISITPGVGFDVIPTDCLALRIYQLMPDAINLEIAFQNYKGKISRGTLLTTLELICYPGNIRENGKIIDSEIGEFEKIIDRSLFKFRGISIPWGDISTAFHSTGIPNIKVYLGLSTFLWQIRKIIPLIKQLFSNIYFRRTIQSIVKLIVSGPSKRSREKAFTIIWCKLENNAGEIREEAYKFIEGYNLTAVGAASASIKVLSGEVSAGTKTPAQAFGSNFMDRFVIKRLI